MATTTKAREIARKIFDGITLRQPSIVASETTGTAGDPVLTFGALTTGTASALIRVVADSSALEKDVIGSVARPFAPHIVQIASEANSAAGAGADNLSRQQLTDILGECIKAGATVEWYEEAFGNTIAETTITVSKLKARFIGNPYFPAESQ
jgi:hypothetical protein